MTKLTDGSSRGRKGLLFTVVVIPALFALALFGLPMMMFASIDGLNGDSNGCDQGFVPAVQAAAPAGSVTVQLSTEVPAPYRDIIIKAAADTPNANPTLVAAIVWKEQGKHYPNPPAPYGTGKAWSVSSAAAQGPFQFIPSTWQRWGKDINGDGFADPNDLVEAAHAAAAYLVSLGGTLGIPAGDPNHPEQKGTIANVMASYNAGPAGNFSNRETTDYVQTGVPYYQHLLTGAPLNGVVIEAAQPAPEQCISAVEVAAGVQAPPGPIAGCVNPFAEEGWGLARTDQGVDFQPVTPMPVYAICDGDVISTDGSGWPGGVFIVIKLTSGPFAGKCTFVAEKLTDVVAVGTHVTAGQVIATAQPGYPWTEWGWASGPQTPSVRYGGSPDGTPMPGGKAFARFLRHLGAHTRDDPGPGPEYDGASC